MLVKGMTVKLDHFSKFVRSKLKVSPAGVIRLIRLFTEQLLIFKHVLGIVRRLLFADMWDGVSQKSKKKYLKKDGVIENKLVGVRTRIA